MRRALVTGGNRGIGRAICVGLKALGVEVVMGARDIEAGILVAEEIGVTPTYLDLQAPQLLTSTFAEFGGFDIVVNNAGVLFDGPILSDPDKFTISMEVMVTGPYEVIRRAMPFMQAAGYGRIANLSSDWGSFAEGLRGPNAYGVAKAALNALTVVAAREAPPGVKINAMCPGWVRTRMGGAGAIRSPEKGAETALWLATLPDDGPTGGFFRDRRAIGW